MRPVGVRAAVVALSVVGALAAAPLYGASAAGSAWAFTHTEKVSRIHSAGGKDVVVDKRTVTVRVNQTSDLRDRQEIDVEWSGAHPTGGIVADQNSGDAMQEEYPVVLLECRGVNPTPETCWTQTAAERFQDAFNTTFPPYRLDRYAPKSQRAAIVGAPRQRPAQCFTASPAEHWVPFKAVSGKTFYGGSGGCAGMAPEAANVGGLALPSNTTYGVTERNGTGAAQFNVWTAESNASLGCSDKVACSLVIVPIMGISCDLKAASTDDAAACTAKGQFAPGQLVQPRGGEDLAVSGALWWSDSNWRNRIAVPLHFAPLSNVCDLVSTGDSVDIYGSETLSQATTQWAPRFCLDPKLFRFKHIQTGEPEARNLLGAGNIKAAFDSGAPPGGYSKPVVNSPTAVTGFGVVYTIDDARGHEYTRLRLTPRLLAKLLTESYPAINAIKEEYSALASNPLNITLDPEFIALNPGITQGVPASQSASALLSLSSDSDVMYALTSYINADPAARAWLNGKPDPWGMVVNPNYKHISLPTASWPLLDSFEPPKMYASGTNDCLYNNPVPYLPLVAAPLARMSSITLAMQYSLASSQTVCVQLAEGVSDGEKLVPIGRQTAGFRFMIGVTSLGDARRYNIATAALQTTVTGKADTSFGSDAGRTFVAPTDSSLRDAARAFTTHDSSGVWTFPYQQVSTAKAMGNAYPGTMLVYTSAPTSGLDKSTARELATFIRFAATTGQRPGFGEGKLPPGFLPMTARNGLAGLVAYAQNAALAVQNQKGQVPQLVAVDDGSSAPDQHNHGPSTHPGPTPPGPSSGAPGAAPTPASAGPASPTPAPTTPAPTEATGFTAALKTGVAVAAIPAVAVIALVAGLLAASPKLADEARLLRARSASAVSRARTRVRKPW